MESLLMMNTMVRVLCTVVLVALATPIASADGLQGAYVITKASNPNGTTYKGTVQITKVGSIYQLKWRTSGGSYHGIGIRVGDVLAVGWGPRGTGVVAYTRDGKMLNGLWAAGTSGKLGTETLHGPSPAWAGQWAVSGSNPGGSGRYKGSLVITPKNPHALHWKVGTSYSGVGIHGKGVLAVGWGKGGVGVVHYKIKGKKLLGRWAIPGARGIGIENLQR